MLTEVINCDKDGYRRIEASGYKLQIDRMFVRYLFAIRHIFKKTEFASDLLQKPPSDLSAAADLIDTLKEECAQCRSRSSCKEFWDSAEDLASKLSLPDPTFQTRSRQPPPALQDYVLEAPLSQEGETLKSTL